MTRPPKEPSRYYNNAASNNTGGKRVGGTHGLRDVLGLTLSKHRLQGGIRKARGIVLWPEIVGPELARMTRARTQEGTTLFVEVRDSNMAHFLTMQRATFISMLQEKLGDQSVTELRFSVGTLQQKAAAALPEPLPPPDQARAEALAAQLPPGASEDLQRVTLQAAQAITRARRWREQQGYAPCPVCGEPSRQRPCRACELNLQDPLVRRAAQGLLRDPASLQGLESRLGNSGADAARYLALQTLDDQLRGLVTECVRSAGDAVYTDFLRQQAESYLRLLLRRPTLQPSDWQALPVQVRGVLKV